MTTPTHKALEALSNVFDTLKRANETAGGPIRETIWHANHETLFDYIESEIAALSSELSQQAEVVKDAERYRWLRDQADFMRVKEGSPQVCLTDEWGEVVSTLPSAYPRGEKLDDAIDAAIAQQAQKEPLTEAQIGAIFKTWRSGALYIHVARAVERAHGIGEKP